VTETSSHICTATMTYLAFAFKGKPSPNKHVVYSCILRHNRTSDTFLNLSFTHSSIRRTKMPVPLPSTTDKSTSSASTQTAQDVEKSSTQSVASATHTEKTEAEMQAERLYEERMEEEYAKREGGA
jgi:hypothetical protein